VIDDSTSTDKECNMMRLCICTLIGASLLSSCGFRINAIMPATSSTGNTYFIDGKTGADSDPGSQARPWKTIQKCLTVVAAGETCQVAAGTYNESLTLNTSGTASLPIIIKCEMEKICIVNSGTSQTLVTGGAIHYYIIDGFSFISSTTNVYTVDFGANINQPITTPDVGNNYLVLRNCYVEGTVRFFGAYNLVENCEFNGNSNWPNGITDKWVSSHHNTYKNNVIHGYKARGVWTMALTDTILIEGNNIYNTGSAGVDCDAAANHETHCYVHNNNIHDMSGEGVGILYENCFNCTAEGNTIYNVKNGISVINYGVDYTSDGKEYRNIDTPTIIQGNLIYNTFDDGINCAGSPGGTAVNNTIYKSNQSRDYFGGIGLSPYGGYYCHNWTIKNNIISQPKASALFFESSAAGLTNVVSDYNFFDFGTSEKKFVLKKSATDVNYYVFSQWAAMNKDTHSVLDNPLFVNAAAGDFHLQPNSLACISGENGAYVGAFPCH
jgi:hypothetical protein